MTVECPHCHQSMNIHELDAELHANAACPHCQAVIAVAVSITLVDAPVSTPAPAKTAPGGPVLLLAMTDPDLRGAYGEALSRAGYHVIQTSESRETLQCLGRDVPRGVVLDGGFPAIFGMGVGEIIRKSNVTRKTKVLGLRADGAADLPVPGADHTIPMVSGIEAVVNEALALFGGVDRRTPAPAADMTGVPAPEAPGLETTPTQIESTDASEMEAPESEATPTETPAPGLAADAPEWGMEMPPPPVETPTEAPVAEESAPAEDVPQDVVAETPPMEDITTPELTAEDLMAEPPGNDDEEVPAESAAETPEADEPAGAGTSFLSKMTETAPTEATAPAAPAAQAPADDPDHAAAQRLTRIIMSDISLYNQAAIEEGIKNDTLREALEPFLEEGREHYVERTSEEIRNSTNYFDEEVERFIARKMAAASPAPA
ncbi:MAG: hypothetical protein ACE5FN_06655 [Leptospirillia bacterium]